MLLDPVLERVAHELLSSVEVELAKDVPDVVLNRLFGNEQLCTDLPVGMDTGDELQDLAL